MTEPSLAECLEWGRATNPLLVHLRAFMPLRVYTTYLASLSVRVYFGTVETSTGYKVTPTDSSTVRYLTVDLSSYVPDDGPDYARWVLITVNDDGDIVATPGTAVTPMTAIASGGNPANVPAKPADTAQSLALVRMYRTTSGAAQTAIEEVPTSNYSDIVDLRFFNLPILPNIEGLATAETDIDLRLAPDGAGGVEWATTIGGGGGGVGRVLIAEVTPTGTDTVTLEDPIPDIYSSLIIEWAIRSTAAATYDTLGVVLNNDTTGSNYRRSTYFGYATGTVAADGGAVADIAGAISAGSSPSGSFAMGHMRIPFYASEDFNKQVLWQAGARREDTTIFEIALGGGMEWENTDAITRIDFNLAAGDFETGSVIRLYGEIDTASVVAPTAHACKLTRASGNFSVGNNTLTAVEFTAEDYDTDAMHDNSTDKTRITIPTISGVTTGLWRLTAYGYTDQVNGRSDVYFKLNGTTYIGTSLMAGDGSILGGYFGSTEAVLSAGDYAECFIRTSAGAGNVIYDIPASPYFLASFVGKVT